MEASSYSSKCLPARRGFTLVELLVVVAILVLIIALAVPAFNAISGNRSIDSAQNQLAAVIGRARQEAIGQEDYRGVIFFQDPNTGRACVSQVYFPVPGSSTLDLTPNRDELLLPTGVSFRMIETASTSSTNNQNFSACNVILFNGRGEFVSMPWQILNTSMSSNSGATGYALGKRIQPVVWSAGNWPSGMPAPSQSSSFWVDPNYSSNTAGTYVPASALGFILFPDETAYRDQYTQNGSTTYLQDQGISFLINRYTGTLIRSE